VEQMIALAAETQRWLI